MPVGDCAVIKSLPILASKSSNLLKSFIVFSIKFFVNKSKRRNVSGVYTFCNKEKLTDSLRRYMYMVLVSLSCHHIDMNYNTYVNLSQFKDVYDLLQNGVKVAVQLGRIQATVCAASLESLASLFSLS